jgi:predicted ATP-dependent serine protease
MPRPGDISGKSQEYLSVPSLPRLTEAIGEGFVRGGVYLFAGEPGIGKTTLTFQILGHVAKNGIKVLYVTTEKGLAHIKRALQRVHGSKDGQLPTGILESFFMDDSVDDIRCRTSNSKLVPTDCKAENLPRKRGPFRLRAERKTPWPASAASPS